MINSMAMPSDKDPIIVALATFPVGIINTQSIAEPHPAPRSRVDVPARPQREAGDQVNGFLLCTLVSKSAKRLKARAGSAGVSLPMTIITRCVLRAYHLEAKKHSGALSGGSPDIEALVRLDGIILTDVMTRYPVNKGRPGRNREGESSQRFEDSTRIRTADARQQHTMATFTERA